MVFYITQCSGQKAGFAMGCLIAKEECFVIWEVRKGRKENCTATCQSRVQPSVLAELASLFIQK